MERSRMVRRVRVLLDKAAATPYPEAADALITKAFELMARHHIDEALLEAADGAGRPDRIVEPVVPVGSGGYVHARLRLLAEISDVFGARCLTSVTRAGRHSHLVGYDGDAARTPPGPVAEPEHWEPTRSRPTSNPP